MPKGGPEVTRNAVKDRLDIYFSDERSAAVSRLVNVIGPTATQAIDTYLTQLALIDGVFGQVFALSGHARSVRLRVFTYADVSRLFVPSECKAGKYFRAVERNLATNLESHVPGLKAKFAVLNYRGTAIPTIDGLREDLQRDAGETFSDCFCYFQAIDTRNGNHKSSI